MKTLLMNERARLFYSCLARGDANLHFGQFGEDAVIMTLLRKVPAGFYVDIGAFAPFRYSNTALLHHERGWRGINVDLDERAIARLREERPRDINICCGVGGAEGEMEAMVFDDGAINTLDAARQLRFSATSPGAARRKVRVRTLPSLLDEHLPADVPFEFLNVDVEGLDHEVLAANDWDRFRPRVIAVETHGMDLGNPQGNAVVRLLASKGYRLQSHIFITSIFVRA